jgi:hypothetical protein
VALLIGCVADPCLGLNAFGEWCRENAPGIIKIDFLRHERSLHDPYLSDRSHFVAETIDGREQCAWVSWTAPYSLTQVLKVRDSLMTVVQQAQRRR